MDRTYAMNPDPFDEPTRPVAIYAAHPIARPIARPIECATERIDDALDLDTLDLDDDTDPAITPWHLTSLRELADFLDEETLPD